MKKRSLPIYDCVIVGAGAAGLAAADRLLAAGKKIKVIEARDRLGGRVHTLSSLPGDLSQSPIELGPEFVHGDPKTLYPGFQKRGLASFTKVPDRHLAAKLSKQNKKSHLRWMEDPSYWSGFEKALGDSPETDLPFARHWSRQHSGSAARLRAQREFVYSYIEGFAAADPKKISAQSVYEAFDSEGNAGAFWPRAGYLPLLQKSCKRIFAISAKNIAFNTRVQTIDIKNRQVISSTGQIFRAKNILVTLPVGVLKSKQIEWPELPLKWKSALSGFEMGHILKGIFQLRRDRWESWKSRHQISRFEGGYIHPARGAVRVLWLSRADADNLLLTAWIGYSEAIQKKNAADSAIAADFDRHFSQALGLSLAEWREFYSQFYFHSWSRDPLSLGAYSYFLPDGWKKVEALLDPELSAAQNLYFAGEAFSKDRSGTVDGALISGRAAAEKILKASS